MTAPPLPSWPLSGAVDATTPAGDANPAGAPGTAGANMSLAAWSVQADGRGSVTVTMRELADAAKLKQALAANGVPALLHFGRGPCGADHALRLG